MKHCIFDRNDECTHNCEGCEEYMLQCSQCGESNVLFDVDGATYCIDCLIKMNGEQLYSDFSEEYNEEFRDFCMTAWEGDRVYSPDSCSM